MKHPFLACACLAVLVCTGCGDAIAVSGLVTRAGKPVEDAAILFVPKGETKGPSVSGKITKGRYSISVKEGLQTGRYAVKVSLPVTRRHFQRPLVPDQVFAFEREIAAQNAHIDFKL